MVNTEALLRAAMWSYTFGYPSMCICITKCTFYGVMVEQFSIFAKLDPSKQNLIRLRLCVSPILLPLGGPLEDEGWIINGLVHNRYNVSHAENIAHENGLGKWQCVSIIIYVLPRIVKLTVSLNRTWSDYTIKQLCRQRRITTASSQAKKWHSWIVYINCIEAIILTVHIYHLSQTDSSTIVLAWVIWLHFEGLQKTLTRFISINDPVYCLVAAALLPPHGADMAGLLETVAYMYATTIILWITWTKIRAATL